MLFLTIAQLDINPNHVVVSNHHHTGASEQAWQHQRSRTPCVLRGEWRPRQRRPGHCPTAPLVGCGGFCGRSHPDGVCAKYDERGDTVWTSRCRRTRLECGGGTGGDGRDPNLNQALARSERARGTPPHPTSTPTGASSYIRRERHARRRWGR
jgi:hypothetical protein